VADPVASGLVARLDRPSGNVTGFALLEPTLGGKWLELLSEIAPGLRRAAIMFNPDTAGLHCRQRNLRSRGPWLGTHPRVYSIPPVRCFGPSPI
jgi:ABC-type uncharacterized transport system substrate-binding protein